jgi:tRNA modification GTPase
VLDEVLVLPMLAPRSYTREDVVEIHCHGGSLCSARVLAATVAVRLSAP